MAELLTEEIVADFKRRAAELPDNGNQDIGSRRKLRQELQNLCGLSEIQAINILNGLYIKEYMVINKREWVKNERERIKSENT